MAIESVVRSSRTYQLQVLPVSKKRFVPENGCCHLGNKFISGAPWNNIGSDTRPPMVRLPPPTALLANHF